MACACSLVVKEFYVFTTQPQGEIIPEREKILYFYPNGKPEDYQLSATGLCEALLSFTNFFSSVCTVLQTRNGKHCFRSISDRIWAVMNVSFVDPSILPHGYEACERFIDDNVMSHKLATLCERFELLFGPVLTASETEVKESRKNLQTFFNRELAMIDLSLNDIPDLIEAVRWKFCSPQNLLKLENLGTQIQLSCPFPRTDAAFLYDAQLVWSTPPLKDLRVVLQYVTSDIMSMPPDLDLSAISSGAPHMGRFLTGPSDMGIELCPAQTPVPILYQRLPNSEYRRIHVVVYRALRLTLCLLIDGEHKLEKEFFHTFDAMYGNALTELSSDMEADSSEGTSLSSDVATLPPVIEASSKTNQGTSGFPSLRGFLLWEPELASVTTNLFFISSGGRGEVIPSFASLLPIIFAARKDAISSFNQRWYECLVKLEPDTWMYLRRLNKREIFLIFSGKKVDISTVISESKRFWVEKLIGLFRMN